MSFLDTLKSGFSTTVDAISTVAQTFVEKNRTNAKLNRLRSVMKSESELMNRAYIALGKGYYEQIKKGEQPNSEREAKLTELIDNCKAKIARARDCYRKIVESQNEFLYSSVSNSTEEHFKKQDVVDITVACSNENEYASSPFAAAAGAAAAAKQAAADSVENELMDDELSVDELF